ncbi:MAG: sigma-70 family RNA polymerase sigma factor [Marmoricola sp.]
MDHADTATLVDAARRGDRRAWDTLVERFLPLVCGVIARFGMYGAEAEDVNQTVWLRLVEHLDALREPRALPGWIVTTTRHECLRAVDKARRVVPMDPHSSAELAEPLDDRGLDDDLLRLERQQALREALAELPDDRRELLLILMVDPPVPYREISEQLGIPVGSIGPTRARALDQLRHTKAMRRFVGTTEQRR